MCCGRIGEKEKLIHKNTMRLALNGWRGRRARSGGTATRVIARAGAPFEAGAVLVACAAGVLLRWGQPRAAIPDAP